MKAKLGRAAQHTQCLKVTEKVAFNIASEASYVYILSRQKFMKNAPKWSILASFWKPETCCVTRQVNFNRTKIGGMCQNLKTQIRHFGWFSYTVHTVWNWLKKYHFQVLRAKIFLISRQKSKLKIFIYVHFWSRTERGRPKADACWQN